MTTTELLPHQQRINKDLFFKTLARIEADQSHFDMEETIAVSDCGTVCCFAGFVCLEAGVRFSKGSYQYVDVDSSYVCWDLVHRSAIELLSLTGDEAASLFYQNRWPYQFRGQLENTRVGTPEYFAIAHRRFHHFWETGE